MNEDLLKNFSKTEIEDVIIAWKSDLTEFYFGGEYELTDIDWSYARSFFYAFQLCSTVGYGDIYPSTSYGQVFAIIYTLLGIPLHVLFLTMLEESFARSCQKILIRVKGDQDTPLMTALGYLGFFLPWITVFFVLPAICFMFMENWTFMDGVYYSFITLTAIGQGNYIAGSKVVSKTTFSVYKLLTFFWMMYGLAFTGLLISSMTHLYQMHLLFSFECSCRKRKCKLKHYYVDVEKMDFHFMLIRAEAVRPGYTIWVIPKRVREGVCFKIYQTKKLSKLCEKIQMKIISILEDYILSSTEIFTAKSMKTLPKTIKQ